MRAEASRDVLYSEVGQGRHSRGTQTVTSAAAGQVCSSRELAAAAAAAPLLAMKHHKLVTTASGEPVMLCPSATWYLPWSASRSSMMSFLERTLGVAVDSRQLANKR